METTKDSVLSDAELCRRNGWGPGARLMGDEGHGPVVIEVTAVGECRILAKVLSCDGKPEDGTEQEWTLKMREWARVG